jgi:coenzyme F420 hydrogenase subunit beta
MGVSNTEETGTSAVSGEVLRRTDPDVRRVSKRYHRLLEEALDSNEWAYAWRSEINRGGFRAVDFLMEEIVDAGKCIGCASCVTICPVDVFDYVDERPTDTRTDSCVRCVLCAEVCPVLRPQDKNLATLVEYREPRTDEGYGPYSYAFYARATRPDIVERAQDGGVVSALLLHALETGVINGAILGDVMPGNRLVGRHKLALTEEDVLSCAASRYTYSPNTLAFREAMRGNVNPVAVVGVPCQVEGLRLEQNSGIRSAMSNWYRTNVALTIGLFCSESFTHESIQKLARMIGVAPERIAHVNIKGKVVVRLDDGTVVNASLKRYREFARPACLYCRDYSAEHADLSVGGIGLDGWTYTLVRTEAGHRNLQAAIDAGWIETRPLADEPRGEILINQLSAQKKANRPHPALMPTLQERTELGNLDPKTFYGSGPAAPPAPARKTTVA